LRLHPEVPEEDDEMATSPQEDRHHPSTFPKIRKRSRMRRLEVRRTSRNSEGGSSVKPA
jgi:hypothetical protein